MSLKTKLEKRIKEKELEINSLEVKLKEIRAYIQATQDALRLLPKELSDLKKSDKSDFENNYSARPGSLVDQTVKILNEAGQPMRAIDIVAAMGREKNNKNKQILVGSIGPYVRKKRLFIKTAPNTFGLIEWGQKKEEASTPAPPKDFGLG